MAFQMIGLLKCLGMLVKKKERLFLSSCEIKEPEPLFKNKKIYQVFIDMEQRCLLALIEIVWRFKTQGCFKTGMRLPVTQTFLPFFVFYPSDSFSQSLQPFYPI